MIISANTLTGQKTKVYDKDGVLIELPIRTYNTETQEAEVYELDENGRVKMTEWDVNDKKMTREPVLKIIKLDGSYAEIDGRRV
ncbi:MAG TPA: hypothetical protein DDY18_11870 [Flavobacterium sp.]|jgi:hypothetical protein|nr:hypothetical protein [Flavobacterium sp.]